MINHLLEDQNGKYHILQQVGIEEFNKPDDLTFREIDTLIYNPRVSHNQIMSLNGWWIRENTELSPMISFNDYVRGLDSDIEDLVLIINMQNIN